MRKTILGVVIAGVVMMAGSVRAADSLKFGGPVDVATATAVSELHAAPERFVGKTIRVDGLVTAVCESEGCWVAVKDARTDHAVRFQAEHDGKIAFPLSLKGRSGSFQGEFVRIGQSEHSHGDASDFGSRYQIKVTGAVVAER